MKTTFDTVADYTPPQFEGAGSPRFDCIAAGMAAIALRYEIGGTPEPRNSAEEWEIVRAIQDDSRQEVTREYSLSQDPWSAKDAGNCYTHSLRLASTMNLAGYESGVAFCNDHAFVLVRSPRLDGTIYMLNPDSRNLTIGNISTGNPQNMLFRNDINQQIAEKGFEERIVTTVYTEPLQSRSPITYEYGRKKSYKNPWVADKYPAAVIMSVEEANRSLYYYRNFVQLLEQKNISLDRQMFEIGQLLGLLVDHNPQMETREDVNGTLKSFKRVVTNWARAGASLEDLDVLVDAYGATMPDTFSKDIFLGDVYRRIAKHGSHRPQTIGAIFRRSIGHYESAVARTDGPGKGLANAKINSCRREAERFVAV